MRGRAIVVVVLLSLVTQVERADAYEPHYTHRWIARMAIEHLTRLYPGQYDELLMFTEDVVDGAQHEDDFILDGDTDPTTLRVMRHFYRPTDGAGLDMGGELGVFPSSFEWGYLGSEENEWDYQDALAAYQRGDKAAAFFAAGHVVHLLSDLTVPAHAHVDEHGPPSGDDYEAYCRDQMLTDFDSMLAVPAANTPLLVADDFETLWELTGNAAYWRNMYPGDLSDPEQPSGVIAEMFPEISVNWLSGDWEIPGVGKLDSAFFEDEPGYFYFKRNSAVPLVDRADFDMLAPRNEQFAATDRSMTAAMADDLVPLAILASATALKLFLDEARELQPIDPELPDLDTDPPLDDAGGCAVGGRGSAASMLLLSFALLLTRRRRTR